MNNETCECGHPKGRHEEINGISSKLHCLHCSCKEFYPREKHIFEEPMEDPRPAEPVEEWPKRWNICWQLTLDGEVGKREWNGGNIDKGLRDFLGLYRTREEAESVRDKVREFVKSLKK